MGDVLPEQAHGEVQHEKGHPDPRGEREYEMEVDAGCAMSNSPRTPSLSVDKTQIEAEAESPAVVCLCSIRKRLEQANSLPAARASAEQQSATANSTSPASESTLDPYAYCPDDSDFEDVVPSAAQLDLADLCARMAADHEILGHVEGRKVVIVLGKTGAGKTTFLHFVAGRKLRRERHHEKEVFVADEGMEGFTIGHEQASETKCVRHYDRLHTDGSEPVLYLDTPGYKDSDGPLVDLATSTSFRRVAGVCGQLRFAVLINVASFLERGEAIKEVASLISSLASFEKHRYIFTFLFTHTDSLKETEGIPMGTVKDKLVEWLKLTRKGVRCERTREVLHWMKHCLLNNLPFVDIWHPEHSSMESLAASVEMFAMLQGNHPAALGLQDGQSAREVVRCGMTGAQESTLKLALHSLQVRLSESIENERLSIIPGTVKILAEIHEYIGSEVTRQAWIEAEALLKRKCKALLAEAEVLTCQGVDPSEIFSVEMGLRSLDCMAVLDAFSDLRVTDLVPQDVVKALLCQLRHGLRELRRSVCEELADPEYRDLAAIEAKLLRMQVWAEVHPEFAPLCQAGLEATSTWIAAAVHAGREEEKDDALVAALDRLQRVQLQSMGLCRLGLSTTDAQEALESALQEALESASERLRLRIEDASTQADAAIKQVQMGGAEGEVTAAPEEALRVLQSNSVNLERLAALLERTSTLQELQQTVAGACSALLQEVHMVVTAFREGVVASATEASSCSTDELALRVTTFHALVSNLTNQQSSQTSAKLLFIDALQEMLADVGRLAAGIRQRCKTLGTSGVEVPEDHVQPLQALAERAWLDRFVQGLEQDMNSPAPEQSSVRALLAEFEGVYLEHFQGSAQGVITALEAYLEQPGEREERLAEVRRLLPRARAASHFTSIFPRVETQQLLETRVHELLASWSQGRWLQDPVSASLASASTLDASGETLSVCSALSFLNVEGLGSALEELSANIKTQLQPYALYASELMSTQGQFREKRELADRLTSWQKDGLAGLVELFPTIDTFQACLKREVEDLSSRARAAITDGKDTDLAERLLLQLNEARHLDGYSSGMASRDFLLLEQLFKLQQTKLDEALRSKIESCNFAGIQDLLAPLVSSRNPVMKEQLKEVMRCISSSLTSRADAARASLPCGPEVASHIQVLQTASEEVGSLLQEHASVDVHKTLGGLKICVAEQCRERLALLDAALDPLDGQALLNWCYATQSYLGAVSCIVGCQFLTCMGNSVAKALRRLERVLPLCETFLCDVSKQSDEGIDTSDLLQLLRQLQRAGTAKEAEGNYVDPMAAPLPLARYWLVTGGKSEGGVRVWQSKNGAELPEKLAYGSLVAELSRDGDWLEYEKLSRAGPANGWVRPAIKHMPNRPREDFLVEVDTLWEVPQGSSGVECQIAQDPSSACTDSFLAAGAQVKQLELHGDRLKFRLLTGEGAAVGWTHVTLDGKELLSLLHRSETPKALTAQHCTDLYRAATGRLRQGLNVLHQEVLHGVRANHLHLMALCIYTNLNSEVPGGVLSHVSDLEFDVSAELGKIRKLQQKDTTDQTRLLESWSMDNIENTWVPMLSKLRADSRSSVTTLFGLWALPEYKEKCCLLVRGVQGVLSQAQSQLKAGNFECAGSFAILLLHVCNRLGGHIVDPQAQAAPESLTTEVQRCFQKTSEDLHKALSSGNDVAFEALFRRYHKFMYNFAPTFKVLQDTAHLLHKDLLEALEDREKSLHDRFAALDFMAASEEVRTLRKFGRLLTGIFAVYQEDLGGLLEDVCLQRIGELRRRHFGGSTLTTLGPHFAVLQVRPHASARAIKEAYRARCREHHPDTHLRRGVCRKNPSAMQQRVQQAFEEVSKASVQQDYQRSLNEPFSDDIRELRSTLLQRLDAALEEANYRDVQKLMASSEHLHVLADLARPRLDSKSLCSQMSKQVRGHIEEVRGSLFSNWDNRLLRKVQEDWDRLSAIGRHLSAHTDMKCSEQCQAIRKAAEDEINTVSHMALADLGDKKPLDAHEMRFALHFLRLGHILDHLPRLKETAAMTMNSMLDFIQAKIWGHQFLFRVGILLERGSVGKPDLTGAVSSEDQRVSRVVVSEFRQFSEVLTVVWNEQTAVTQKDVSATVREIVARQVVQGGTKDLPINRDELRQRYESYLDEYNTQFHKWRAGQLDLNRLANETRALASKLPICRTDSWSAPIREAIPKLLACVFAYFTISKSGNGYTRLFDSRGAGPDDSGRMGESTVEPESVLKKPHNMQVISILQMLGCSDTESTHLTSHLMQVRTGEGKSLLLGGCAVVLGLLGFKVRTVCYSAYLSQRDWDLFSEIFSAFGVSDKVTYGTILSYCKDSIAAKGDVRALTWDLLQGLNNPAKTCRHPLADTEEILLVDEVDVFFGPDFYGQVLNLSYHPDTPEFAQILRDVWNSRTELRTPQRVLERVKASSSYQQLLDRFPQCHYLIESEVWLLCNDLHNFGKPSYHFNYSEQKIGYQQMDDVNYNWIYGYRTAFAYLNEVSKMRIHDPQTVLRKALSLRIPCGSFSYANIKPACILGVSGTISALGVGDYEWRVLNRYGIHTYCEMPSVYGKSKLRTLDQEDVQPIIVADSKDDWFVAITDQVNEMARRGRASIVVFRPKHLEEYKESTYFKQVVNKSELCESHTTHERESVIKKAAIPGHTTFITEIFGRGSDFFCFDHSLQDSGGVHVIITSFPLDRSLEMQIDGRTARQGQKGSRSMVLLARDLSSTFDIGLASIRENSQPSSLYRLLDEARQRQRGRDSEKVEQDLLAATKKDGLSRAYLDALLAGDPARALAAYKDLHDVIGAKANGS